MRYEDLVLNPTSVLSDLFCFLLEVSSIKGTIVEKRIADIVTSEKKPTAFELKINSKTGLNGQNYMYSEAQQEMIKRECRDWLYYFNYTDNGNLEADPSTTFFTYDGET